MSRPARIDITTANIVLGEAVLAGRIDRTALAQTTEAERVRWAAKLAKLRWPSDADYAAPAPPPLAVPDRIDPYQFPAGDQRDWADEVNRYCRATARGETVPVFGRHIPTVWLERYAPELAIRESL